VVRHIRAENLATTEVVVAALPYGVAATTKQIGKTCVSLKFHRRPRGSMIEVKWGIMHCWLMQLMKQWSARMLHQQRVLHYLRFRSISMLNFGAEFAHFSLAEGHDQGQLQRSLIDQDTEKRTCINFEFSYNCSIEEKRGK